MKTYVETSRTDFSLSPLERRQRQEIMAAFQTIQSAIELLSKQQDPLSCDLKTRTILTSSQQCMAKLQSFVEQTLNTSIHT